MNAPESSVRPGLPRGVLLGIDQGEKVIGLALCDASWVVARPAGLLIRTTRRADFAQINALITEHQAKAVVVGYPEPQPENVGPKNRAGTVRRWASRLAAAVPVPVYFWEEQFSSHEAELISAELGRIPTRRLDDLAAAVILQSFINAHPAGHALPPPIKHRD